LEIVSINITEYKRHKVQNTKYKVVYQ
jgi:hypothetical protein